MITEPRAWLELVAWLLLNGPRVEYFDLVSPQRQALLRTPVDWNIEIVQIDGGGSKELEKAIRELGEMGEFAWMGLEEPLRKCLALRIDAAREFAYSLSAVPPEADLIPYPNVPRTELIAWLLIDWWAKLGRELAALRFQRGVPFEI